MSTSAAAPLLLPAVSRFRDGDLYWRPSRIFFTPLFALEFWKYDEVLPVLFVGEIILLYYLDNVIISVPSEFIIPDGWLFEYCSYISLVTFCPKMPFFGS